MPGFPGLLRRLRPRAPRWRDLGWICLSAVAWAFCYPPFPLGPLAFVVLLPAFFATMRLNTRQAFLYHFAAGIAYNTVMYWWIYNVIKVGPAFVIGAGLVLLILYLSFFNALLGWLFRILAGKPFGLAAYPLLWGGLEVVRTMGEMSFPWNDMGYTLGHWPSLIQSVSFLGIFGLSMAVIACNCLAFTLWRGKGRIRWAAGAVAAAIPLALAVQGRLSLARPDPVNPPTLDISLVQPSIPQTKKWDEDYFREVMEKTWDTMEGHPNDSTITKGTDLIVLAETAVPDFLRSRADLYDRFRKKARDSGADILVGALDYIPDPKPYHTYLFYNSAFLFPAKGDSKSVLQYSKLRLVPFSERLPFDDVFPIINYVNLGEGDFSSGPDYEIWTRGVRYAPSICYEIIYPDFVRGARRRGAQLLVNITNDGWFGYSNAPFMHANISRFRAIEAGAPIARCSNAGISVFYDYKGRVLGKTRLSEVTVLRRKVPLISRDTWYLRHGDAVEGFLAWFFVPGFLGCWYMAWRDNRETKKRSRLPHSA
ncbi:MAG: apolipoprotein N-acyltransferase [Fibrobacteres bacterium]|nr:apolipoprotein N-acyltransferase [Fibrobacterota bacterium]